MGRVLLLAFDSKINEEQLATTTVQVACCPDSLEEKYTLVPTHMMPRIQESERSLKKKLARSNRDYVPLPTSASRQV